MSQDNNLTRSKYPSLVLVIEDEVHIAEGIKINLELIGHEVIVAQNGKVGLEKWQEHNPQLIVLDIMMPELDGLQVLKKIRQTDSTLPVLILSAKNESTSKVNAFAQGVDDYLAKPFSLEEFLHRTERLLIRANPVQNSKRVMSFGPNTIDFDNLSAQTAHGKINLTEQEIKVLELFLASPNKALKREELLQAGWGYTEDVNTRTLDNFMVRFRKYFEPEPKNPRYFHSVRAVGYLWDPSGSGR